MRDEIKNDGRRQDIFKGLKKKDDIEMAVKETLDAFDATIAIVPNGAYEGALYNSLFLFPGLTKKHHSRGLHFVAKFAMDESPRKFIGEATGKRNETLMVAFLECLTLMDET